MKRGMLFLILAFLAGCEVSSRVVPMGPDTFVVSSHVGACVSCSAAVKSMEAANEFCVRTHKVAIVRNVINSTNPFGYVVGNETIFSCVSKDDPEYTRPTLQKQ